MLHDSGRCGERMTVRVKLQGANQQRVVPWSAVMTDINGGTWVYENTAAHTYVRRRVQVRFQGAPPTLPDWLQRDGHNIHDGRLEMDYTGPLPPLLEWLARQSLADLRLEPLGLASIYHRYHATMG